MENLARFQQTLYEEAKRALQAERPEYVSKFEERLNATQNLEKAIEEAKPFLGNGLPKRWKELLEATLDLELAVDKLNKSLVLFKARPVNAASNYLEGIWVTCHLDLWIFYSDALAERLGKVVSRSCRTLLRDRGNPDWQSIQKALMSGVNEIKREVSGIRNKLAHGGFGVEGIEKNGLWERSIIIGHPERQYIIRSSYESSANFKDSWPQHLERASTAIREKTNETIGKVYERVFAGE